MTADLASDDAHTVSVIMPTRALSERAILLWQAIESVITQEGVRVIPLVIINGSDGAPMLVNKLRADRRLRVATLEDADLPAALWTGRKMVDTCWFTELDDDDILLPGALAVRVQALKERAACDAVITNGFRRSTAGDRLQINNVSTVERDPLRALMRQNWLLPGAWLCRTDRVGAAVFEGMPRFLECTYLALQFSTRFRIIFLERPTIVWHADTPLSESNSRDYVLGQVSALRRILDLDLPADVRSQFQTRVSDACHTIASLHLNEYSMKEAWGWHLRSLCERGGWCYLPFTRRFVYTLWRH